MESFRINHWLTINHFKWVTIFLTEHFWIIEPNQDVNLYHPKKKDQIAWNKTKKIFKRSKKAMILMKLVLYRQTREYLLQIELFKSNELKKKNPYVFCVWINEMNDIETVWKRISEENNKKLKKREGSQEMRIEETERNCINSIEKLLNLFRFHKRKKTNSQYCLNQSRGMNVLMPTVQIILATLMVFLSKSMWIWYFSSKFFYLSCLVHLLIQFLHSFAFFLLCTTMATTTTATTTSVIIFIFIICSFLIG